MGALKYVEELQKKKQSDVLRFLLRVRCWELRQLNVIHRASRPSRPDKARRLGYKAKQGYVIYRARVRRGGRKRPVPKGATYGKPTNQGVNQLKYQRSLKSTAEERVGRRCANLRVLNSYWINQDSTYKYYEVILVDPQHKAIRKDARINWIVNPVHKHRESRGLTATGKKSRGLGRGHKFNKTTAGRRKTWKRHNTLSLWRYSKAIIDRCLLTYLEARGRRELATRAQTVKDYVSASVEPVRELGSVPITNEATFITETFASGDARTATITPVTPTDALTGLHSATIKDAADFEWFPMSMTFPARSSSSPVKPTFSPIAPISTSPKKDLSGVASIPPLPSRKPPLPPDQLSSPSRATPPLPNYRAGSKVNPELSASQQQYERVKTIFKPLEDYLRASYGDYECLNSSFSTLRPRATRRTHSDSVITNPPPEPADGAWPSPKESLSQLDGKTLLLGDFAENGYWWTGRIDRSRHSNLNKTKEPANERKRTTTSKTAHIDWDELQQFYQVVHTAGEEWREKLDNVKLAEHAAIVDILKAPTTSKTIDEELSQAREHTKRALLKITENLLKRPSRPLTDPDHVRFLVLILSNPSLYPPDVQNRAGAVPSGKPGLSTKSSQGTLVPPNTGPSSQKLLSPASRDQGQHAGILKRIFGLLSNSSDTCHRYLTGWFSRFSEQHFVRTVDLVASFVTYRMSRRQSRNRSSTVPHDGGLIPDLSGSARNTFAQLQSATGLSGSGSGAGRNKMPKLETQSVVDYSEDWQLKAAARVMALFFAANNAWQTMRVGSTPAETKMTSLSRPRAKTHGQLLPTSDFYNTLLDYHDLVADFKAWESKKAKYTFCQYPFFLSMGAKIKILEYDARRQMELKAREAYFDSVTTQRAIDGYFHLRIRRECMVDDSLKQISGAVGAGAEELKKGLRIHFTGEEGVDAGGLRKEWFLMLVRDIFDPNHGMFIYDDDSQACYFNPNSFETSDQYYLVGALLGLAIYNSTILDVALPPFAFRKLLASAPASTTNTSLPTAGVKHQMTYTLDDLAEYRPALAAGLRHLLDFEGDVETTFCRDFVAPVERYGVISEVPLYSGGEGKAVTNANRKEFVDLYVRYLLDTAVARQFEPFKRGFFTVCAGNALSLFRPEEIELLVRGSDEALDVDSLKAVAVYENWRSPLPPHKPLPNPVETVPVIGWFWDFFRNATPPDQRKILSFVTSSDRIPAVGATNLVLRIVAGGDGTGKATPAEGERNNERFPIARTCFNMLVLWGYETREKLEAKLWRAVCESEGFGLK
ncbi:hypothetical protein MBLNU459_g5609t3 [Dothideomycetes sp. NU459]